MCIEKIVSNSLCNNSSPAYLNSVANLALYLTVGTIMLIISFHLNILASQGSFSWSTLTSEQINGTICGACAVGASFVLHVFFTYLASARKAQENSIQAIATGDNRAPRAINKIANICLISSIVCASLLILFQSNIIAIKGEFSLSTLTVQQADARIALLSGIGIGTIGFVFFTYLASARKAQESSPQPD